MAQAEHHALVSLMLLPQVGHKTIGRLIETFGSAQAAFEASVQDLQTIERISNQKASRIRQAMDQMACGDVLGRELALIERFGVQVVSLADSNYPKLLRLIPDPPVMLYVRGQVLEQDALALAIVGARKCTHYGREQADRFAYAASVAGLTVVSGGAYGVDQAAHRAALRFGGRTLAVVGSGLANPYPKEHAPLFDQIVNEEKGAVISEFPMEAAPLAENFPRRNRIVSGLSLGVLVIEAAVRSGALITARLCVEEHGRECMALPGRVDSAVSQGCHKMIRQGWAKLVTHPVEVLEGLGEAGELLLQGAGESGGSGGQSRERGNDPNTEQKSLLAVNLTESQSKIVQVLVKPLGLDQVVAGTQLPVPVVQADLTLLEIRGLVKRKQGRFVNECKMQRKLKVQS